ncbi:MAG: MurR/RpiR family transcriptional regulator, partial [Myxococcota bacterium]
PREAGDRLASGADTVRMRVATEMDRMTRSEKRAAHVLLADYPMIGLENINTFAERAKVSTATLQRLVTKLGFDSFSDFRTSLRSELAAVREGPLTMARWYAAGDAAPSDLKRSLMTAVEATLDGIEGSELDATVRLLVDPRRRIYLAGGAFTHSIARHLHFHLRKMRPGVVLLEEDMPRRCDSLLDMRRRDVLVAFDIRRYQPDMRLTANLANERGGSIVLITDQWMSEIAEIAAHIFRCKVDAATPWDTIVGLVAVVEQLAASVDEVLWQDAKPRLEQLDAIRDSTFVPTRDN